ncbi:hypothetical protein [Jeotgalibacillus proteolyticus]|uniref:hypothetical protein n=1 Tax=Jeotgalibacillus proteolyticus TaxID=2082395 RepID=UPI001431EB18|nr:hypothetical protein [Jeotgalibacillus proteolyticus]
MKIIDRFSKNNDVSLHYLESQNESSTVTPLVYLPGILSAAEQFKNEIQALSPRH